MTISSLMARNLRAKHHQYKQQPVKWLFLFLNQILNRVQMLCFQKQAFLEILRTRYSNNAIKSII